jgi:peptidoglycan hydrolase CwlO-like protein
METVLTLISTLLGCSTLVGFALYGKANRRIKDAEAEKSEAEANEVEDHRFDNLLKLVDSLTSRLSTLNTTVDKHIDRNRELSDRVYKSETELNRLNERIIALTEERDNERSMKEHYKMWHCRKSGCEDRIPPNDKLKGLKYEPPKRAVK